MHTLRLGNWCICHLFVSVVSLFCREWCFETLLPHHRFTQNILSVEFVLLTARIVDNIMCPNTLYYKPAFYHTRLSLNKKPTNLGITFWLPDLLEEMFDGSGVNQNISPTWLPGSSSNNMPTKIEDGFRFKNKTTNFPYPKRNNTKTKCHFVWHHLSYEKTFLLSFTFHCTGSGIGILIMVYYTPHIIGLYNPLYTIYPKQPGALFSLLTWVTSFNNSPTGWWFQPIWKIWSSNWIISPSRGENKKHVKPPPSPNFGPRGTDAFR